MEVKCWLLCGEFGCEQMWYWGFAWQSREFDENGIERDTTDQPTQYYGIDNAEHPDLHLPEYRGRYILHEDLSYQMGKEIQYE